MKAKRVDFFRISVRGGFFRFKMLIFQGFFWGQFDPRIQVVKLQCIFVSPMLNPYLGKIFGSLFPIKFPINLRIWTSQFSPGFSVLLWMLLTGCIQRNSQEFPKFWDLPDLHPPKKYFINYGVLVFTL